MCSSSIDGLMIWPRRVHTARPASDCSRNPMRIRQSALAHSSRRALHIYNLSSERVLLMSMGTVKWFNAQRASASFSRAMAARMCSCISAPSRRLGLVLLNEGQKIEFDLVSDQRSGKLSAANLKTVG